jgi:hypothetical protein
MIAACLATIIIFATGTPGMISAAEGITDVSRHIDELGNRVGNVTQGMDDGAERINDCLYGVKRCRSARWKGVRNRLDRFNRGLDKVGNALDKAGDRLQNGVVAK